MHSGEMLLQSTHISPDNFTNIKMHKDRHLGQRLKGLCVLFGYVLLVFFKYSFPVLTAHQSAGSIFMDHCLHGWLILSQ